MTARREASVRRRLLQLATLPFLLLLPALLYLIYQWGIGYYDRLLTFKVSSDLAVAHQYFNHVIDRVGQDVSALGDSHDFAVAVEAGRMDDLQNLLAERKAALGMDFLHFTDATGRLRVSATGTDPADYAPQAWPVVLSALRGRPQTAIDIFSPTQLAAINPWLAKQAHIELVDTPNAVPTERSEEDRGMVVHTAYPVRDAKGRLLGVLEGGVLLNQNLDFVDTINDLVYTPGSLPPGSDGTATLFIDDVRIATNVRLFGDKRALGTRASAIVRNHVLNLNKTWLDLAFVVHDWYISAYEPIHDSFGTPVGMLYVGYLETPFREAKHKAITGIVLLFALIGAGGVWFSLRVARGIYRPIETMNATMRAVQHGDLSARSAASATTDRLDELGRLSEHLDELLDTVQAQNHELKIWGEALDRKVAERTAELEASNALLRDTQRQLALAEKLAAIGEITAGVAHEINNPVAVLQGNLDVLRDTLGAATAPVAEELRLMDQQIHRINLMVTKLLQFASPTEYAGYMESLTPQSVIADSLVLLGPLLKKAEIRVQRDDRATRECSLNRNELQQVLINLITNAMHAMQGGGTLTLSSEDQSLNGSDGVVIHVRDSGVGISAEHLPRVFDAFFTTRPGQGTGLGLSISYTLVARYGGQITVQSVPGQGTCFSVWLPAS
ncbi:MAG TPA: ATP-binding protein [Roseateles sp.]|nr:ATP-binding protein [Roseateles sp.]HWT54266.1 ATP-binding protein [Rhodocyclaceae bacterium]